MTSPPTTMPAALGPDTEIAEALAIARGLAAAGVPIFVAAPDPDRPIGFRLPGDWQHTRPDPAVVDRWAPGVALCAVTGCGLDLLDADARSGADPGALNGRTPSSYGVASTPSGGMHSFIRSLGVRSRDAVLPGWDVKAGDAAGQGRGFAFIAPTVRVSKLTGAPTPYRWVVRPALDRLHRGEADESGAELAELVEAAHRGAGSSSAPDAASFLDEGPWTDVAETLRTLGRNAGVHRLVAALRGRGGWARADAKAYVDAVVWPLIDQAQGGHAFPVEEYDRAFASGWDRYEDGGTERAARIAEQLAAGPSATGSDGTEAPPSGVALTDAAMADRVAAVVFAGRFAWTPGLRWLAWDGRRWAAVDAVVPTNAVREYLIDLYIRAARGGADYAALKALSALLSRARITAILDLARGRVHVDLAAFDSNPDLLNVGNGVLDLRTGELHPHDPGYCMTRLAPVDYRPDAAHPDWTAALAALPGDLHAWWQLRLGQAITGHMTPDDVLLVQVGTGENGKTTVMAGMRACLGDYYAQLSHRVLLASPDAHPTELMDLRGARLALMEETPEERRLSVVRLKATVGTPTITARLIQRDSVTFAASHSMILNTNYLPQVQETDHGTWRRLAAVTFPYRWVRGTEDVVGELDRVGDPGLRDRLTRGEQGQHEALLAWLVAGAVRWYAEGRTMPRAPRRVADDTLGWRASADRVLAYLLDRLVFDADAHIMAAELLTDFNAWQVAGGQREWSRELLASRFGGHSEVLSHGVRKDIIRRRDGLSRPPVAPGLPNTQSSPDHYRAWLGVRFRHPGDDHPPQPPETDNPTPESGQNANPEESDTPTPTSDVTSVTSQLTLPREETTKTQGQIACDTRDKDQLRTRKSSPKSSTERDKPRRVPTPERAATKAAEKAAQRAEAVAAAAGDQVALPAVVDRRGDLQPVPLDEAAAALAGLCERGALTVDVETTGYPVGHRHHALRTVQLGDEYTAFVFDAADPDQQRVIREQLAAAPRLHAHSASADLVPLAAAGLVDRDSAWARMWDTALAAQWSAPSAGIADETGLKALSARWLGEDAVAPAANTARLALWSAARWPAEVDETTPPERNGWAQADSRCATMVRYAASDVLDTAALADLLTWPADEAAERERTVAQMVSRVSHDGIRIDRDRVAELTAAAEPTRDQAAAVLAGHGITNPRSPKQVTECLAALGATLPTTGKGNMSAAKNALRDVLADDPGPQLTEVAETLLTYRRANTALSLILYPFGSLCEHGDGRARPAIYAIGTRTGRMSARRPNLQQLARTGGIRSCLTADPGHVLISADFSGVEIRVAAALSQDVNLMRMIADGVDIHGEIARQVWGPQAGKAERYTAKRIVFGRFYGGGAATLGAQAEVPTATAAEAIRVLDAMAPGLTEWSATVIRMTRAGATSFPSYAGRSIALDPEFAYRTPNYCVQGTARELLVDGLLRWRETPWSNAVLVPIHDELLAVVPEADAEAATAALMECMRTELFGVAIEAEAGAPSFAWRDAA